LTCIFLQYNLASYLRTFISNHYRTAFAVSALILIFYFSLKQNYLLFHSIIELFSIIIAFAVFIITWNSRKMMDNNYLCFVGITYIFIGALDLLHTLTFPGMTILPNMVFYANQFWVATRFMEAATLVVGFYFLKKGKRINSDQVFLTYFTISLLITFAILVWHIFPICFIEGRGQTPFKIYAEYVIIAILFVAGYLLYSFRDKFSEAVYKMLFLSLVFTMLSEFCFTLYASNYSAANELGHYFKLIAFFLIYKANVETGFIKPTGLIFKNLKDNEEEYRTLAENLPGLILRFDQQLNCIYNNTANTHNLLVPALQSKLTPILNTVKENGLVYQDDLILDKDEKKQILNVQVIPEYHVDHTLRKFLVICQDITLMKEAEQELKELNATKDKLFSVIAHDLKNPFTSLISFSELIHKNSEKLSKEKIGSLALRIHNAAKQAYVLLDNLLGWSRLQTGLLKPDFVRIPATSLLQDAMYSAEAFAQGKGITIQIDPSTDQHVHTDAQMISTVLRNLISNAVKFSHADSTIVLKSDVLGNEIRFSVTDSGVGIQAEHQENLLKTSNSVSLPGTAAEKGTGLGLILCREFVELCGGKIWFETQSGVGTTFYFTQKAAADSGNMG